MKTQSATNQQQMQKNNKRNNKDKNWLRDPNQLRTPKIFNVKMIRKRNGDFVMIGGESLYLERKNQYVNKWTKVDTRDLGIELRKNRIITR
jgi:hypothetical protein